MHVWRRNLDNLHIKQTEISQKQSKETKICQRGYSIVLKLPSNKAHLIFVSYYTLKILVMYIIIITGIRILPACPTKSSLI